MRRSEREIKDKNLIDKIILESPIIRLGLNDTEAPYIVPMSFGYDGENFFLHSAKEGRKVDLIKKTIEQNKRVSFELDSGFSLITGDNPCSFSCHYQSVIGEGRVSFIEDFEQKKKALSLIMKHYVEEDGSQSGLQIPFQFSDSALNSVVVIKVAISSISCKKH